MNSWQSDYAGSFLSQKGQQLTPMGTPTCSRYECAFCCLPDLRWHHYLGAYKIPNPQAWNPIQQSTPTRKPTVQPKKVCERELIIMGSSGLITSCPIRSCQPKTAGIAHRRYNWISSSEAILFKDREPSLRTVSPGTTASMSLNYKLWLPCEHS